MNDTGIKATPAENPTCPKCGAPLPTDSAPLDTLSCPACGKSVMVPGKIGNYRLIRLLGKGGMGMVFEALDEGLQRPVAIKFILREKVEEDPTFLEEFQREAVSAAKFQHNNVVSTYFSGTLDGQPYLVMEIVRPDSLDRMMAKGPVAAATALNIGMQIAEGLKRAAELGMVHGDVKPENILINADKVAKLADFGIAAASGAQAAKNNEVWGTPYYIAPETLRRQKVDARADIYSLGATLYHAIAGVPPFEGEDAVAVMRARLEGDPRPLQELAPSCPEAIAKVIMRMLEGNPIRRYPNYDALINDMKRAMPKAGSLSGKRLMLKPKGATQQVAPDDDDDAPSRPMTAVTGGNAPLIAPIETKAEGLSKKTLILLSCGIGGTLLVIIGLVIVLLTSLGSDEPEEALPDGAPAAEAEAVPAAPDTRGADRAAVTETVEAATKLSLELSAAASRAESLAKQMAKQAERAILPEQADWLRPAEGEAPTAMLKAVQENFVSAAAVKAGAEAATALRAAVDALALQANAAEATPALVADIRADAEKQLTDVRDGEAVTAARAALKKLETRQSQWRRTVDQGRGEMEAAVRARHEAEQKAAAERKRQEEEARRKAAIDEEVASVQANEAAVSEDLNRFETARAKKTFEDRTSRVKSDEAKAARETIRERLALYDDLRVWIIKEAKAGHLTRQRITAADESGITVNGAKMSWGAFAVDNPVISFGVIRGRICDDREARGMTASQRARLALGSMLFINRYYSADDVAKSKSMQEAIQKLMRLVDGIATVAALRERHLPADFGQAVEAPTPAKEAPAEPTEAPAAEDSAAADSGDDWGGWGE